MEVSRKSRKGRELGVECLQKDGSEDAIEIPEGDEDKAIERAFC